MQFLKGCGLEPASTIKNEGPGMVAACEPRGGDHNMRTLLHDMAVFPIRQAGGTADPLGNVVRDGDDDAQ